MTLAGGGGTLTLKVTKRNKIKIPRGRRKARLTRHKGEVLSATGGRFQVNGLRRRRFLITEAKTTTAKGRQRHGEKKTILKNKTTKNKNISIGDHPQLGGRETTTTKMENQGESGEGR